MYGLDVLGPGRRSACDTLIHDADAPRPPRPDAFEQLPTLDSDAYRRTPTPVVRTRHVLEPTSNTFVICVCCWLLRCVAVCAVAARFCGLDHIPCSTPPFRIYLPFGLFCLSILVLCLCLILLTCRNQYQSLLHLRYLTAPRQRSTARGALRCNGRVYELHRCGDRFPFRFCDATPLREARVPHRPLPAAVTAALVPWRAPWRAITVNLFLSHRAVRRVCCV